MKFVPACIALLIPVIACSQKFNVHSVIVTKTNDSLHVLTADKQSSLSKSIKTLDSATGQYHTYFASAINGIIIGGDDYYVSAVVKIDQTPYNEEVTITEKTFRFKTDTVFLKTEYNSPSIKLFSFKDAKRTHFFAQKNTDSIEELIYIKFLVNRLGTTYETEDRKFIGQLNDLLADCPGALKGINNISYSVQGIQGVFDNYNRICHKENGSGYRAVYKDKFEIAVFAGGGFSTLNERIGGKEYSIARSGFSPLFGVRFNYILPLLQNNLSIVMDLYYNSYHVNSSTYSNYFNDSFYTKNNTSQKDQYISLDILARYYFLDAKHAFRPFVNIGYTGATGISINNTVVTDNVFNASQTQQTSDAFPNNGYRKLQFGLEAGAGLVWNKIGFEYRFRTYGNMLSYTSESMSMTSHHLFLTYRLSK